MTFTMQTPFSTDRTDEEALPSLDNERARLKAIRDVVAQHKRWLTELQEEMNAFAEATPESEALPPSLTPEQHNKLVALERELTEITALLTPAPVTRPLRSGRQLV